MRRFPPAPIRAACLLLSLCLPFAEAQQPAAPPPPGPARDFAAGFDKLRSFGLPDARGGAYVNFASPMEYSERDTLLAGNAWVWEKGSNTPARVLTGMISTKELADSPSGSKGAGGPLALLRMIQSGGGMPEPGKITGTWKPADLAKDVEKVVAKFKEAPDPKKRTYRGNDFLDYEGKVNNPTRWLFFAAHAHRSGHTNQANQIVQSLFATVEDPRLLLAEAVNELAEHGYEAAWESFQAKGDWNAYADAVDALLARYGAAWQNAAGARLLAERLKERKVGKPAELQGPHLDETGLRLAREIALETPQPASTNAPPAQPRQSQRETFWLWGASTNPPPAEAGPWERLTHLGPKAVPVLAALAGDPWLVRQGPGESSNEYDQYARMRMMRSMRGGGSSEGAEGDAKAQYEQMSRPRSRGEVSLGLLQTVFAEEKERGNDLFSAGEGEDEEKADPVPALRKAALEWYNAHQNSPPDAIALHFLSKGNSSMRMQAAQYLLPSTNAAHMAAMETLLRDADRFGQNQHLLSMYANKFPDKAREILLEIAKTKGIDPNAAVERSSDDYEKRSLLRLLESVRPADLSSLLKSIQEKKADHQEHTRLRLALKKADPSTAYPQILQAAAAAKFPESTAILLNSLSGLFRPSEPGKPAPTPPPVQPHAELWRKLLQDQRVVLQGYQSGQAVRMGEANAAHLEELYSPLPASTNHVEEGEEVFDYAAWRQQNRPSVIAHLLGPTGIDLHKRALARLDGVSEDKLPPLPNAKNVPPARTEALAKLLAEAPISADAAFTLDEHLWIAGQSDEHPDWKPNVTNAAHRVTRLEIPNDAPAELRALLQGWKDQVISVERLQPLVKLLCAMPLTASNRQYGVLIERMPALQGVCVHVFAPDDPRHPGRLLGASGRMGRTFPKPVLVTSGDWMRWQWPIITAAPTTPAPAKAGEDEELPEEEDEDEPDSEDSFWEAVRNGLSGEDDPFAAATQSFYVPHPADDASDEDSSTPDIDF